MKEPIRINKKIIGTLDEKSFKKRVKGSIHKLRVPEGWCIDVDVLWYLEKRGCEMVSITDTETSTTYELSMSEITQNGILIDRGHGRQLLVPIKFWKTV